MPAWVVQAHALLNVLCWLGLAALLLRWFPPTGWENFLRWFEIMFSHGVGTSVRHSLVDAPSLLLVAIAMAWLERGSRGRAGAVLALAGLGKETSVLAVAGLADPAARSWRALMRFALTALTVVLLLVARMGYIKLKFGPAEDLGLGNFTLPFFGLASFSFHFPRSRATGAGILSAERRAAYDSSADGDSGREFVWARRGGWFTLALEQRRIRVADSERISRPARAEAGRPDRRARSTARAGFPGRQHRLVRRSLREIIAPQGRMRGASG